MTAQYFDVIFKKCNPRTCRSQFRYMYLFLRSGIPQNYFRYKTINYKKMCRDVFTRVREGLIFVLIVQTGYRLNGWWVSVWFFSFPRRPGRFLCLPSLLSNGYRRWSGLGVKLTTHLQLLPQSRIHGSIHPLPHMPSCVVLKQLSTGTPFPFLPYTATVYVSLRLAHYIKRRKWGIDFTTRLQDYFLWGTFYINMEFLEIYRESWDLFISASYPALHLYTLCNYMKIHNKKKENFATQLI
jgi:hypothetical protein